MLSYEKRLNGVYLGEHVLVFSETSSLSMCMTQILERLVHQSPGYTLDVRAEAIRWEREGQPNEPRGRGHLVPSLSALQCSRGVAPTNTGWTEIAELKELLKKQQEQLNQLTQGLMVLQTAPHIIARFKCPDTVLHRHCQKPGHYVRECYTRGFTGTGT